MLSFCLKVVFLCEYNIFRNGKMEECGENQSTSTEEQLQGLAVLLSTDNFESRWFLINTGLVGVVGRGQVFLVLIMTMGYYQKELCPAEGSEWIRLSWSFPCLLSIVL